MTVGAGEPFDVCEAPEDPMTAAVGYADHAFEARVRDGARIILAAGYPSAAAFLAEAEARTTARWVHFSPISILTTLDAQTE